MRTWDLTSVLQGVDPDGAWFPVSEPGAIIVDADGRTRFTAGAGSVDHRVMLASSFDDAQRARAVDHMVELVSAG